MTDINKITSKDIAYTTAKAAIGSIPIVGAAASELLGLIVAPPLEKRRAKWMTEIGQKLKDLEEVKRIDIQSLTENQQFIDTVLQATSFALKTSDEEKILAFRNAIINTALCDAPDFTMSQIFLNLIDSFTTWHIKILYLFDNPTEWFKNNNKTLPNYSSAGLIEVVTEAFPTLRGQNELLNLIWSDLKRAGLHNSGDLEAMMTGSGLLAQRTTDLGKRFLKFITH
ncbi:MAG: hypothetical protein NT175_01965 [Bacteroidetes bacterium]|nr:hypothetical protein [Bacteroidota bacterium]